jgi:hypothetical protein
VQPVEFYNLADDWFKNGPNNVEALHRSIVSRAYYAVHLEARRNVPAHALGGVGISVHKAICDYFRYSGKPGHVEIGNRILNLLTRRTDADYEMGKPIRRGHATEALQRAYWILTNDFSVPLPPRTPPSAPAPPGGPIVPSAAGGS